MVARSLGNVEQAHVIQPGRGQVCAQSANKSQRSAYRMTMRSPPSPSERTQRAATAATRASSRSCGPPSVQFLSIRFSLLLLITDVNSSQHSGSANRVQLISIRTVGPEMVMRRVNYSLSVSAIGFAFKSAPFLMRAERN